MYNFSRRVNKIRGIFYRYIMLNICFCVWETFTGSCRNRSKLQGIGLELNKPIHSSVINILLCPHMHPKKGNLK